MYGSSNGYGMVCTDPGGGSGSRSLVSYLEGEPLPECWDKPAPDGYVGIPRDEPGSYWLRTYLSGLNRTTLLRTGKLELAFTIVYLPPGGQVILTPGQDTVIRYFFGSEQTDPLPGARNRRVGHPPGPGADLYEPTSTPPLTTKGVTMYARAAARRPHSQNLSSEAGSERPAAGRVDPAPSAQLLGRQRRQRCGVCRARSGVPATQASGGRPAAAMTCSATSRSPALPVTSTRPQSCSRRAPRPTPLHRSAPRGLRRTRVHQHRIAGERLDVGHREVELAMIGWHLGLGQQWAPPVHLVLVGAPPRGDAEGHQPPGALAPRMSVLCGPRPCRLTARSAPARSASSSSAWITGGSTHPFRAPSELAVPTTVSLSTEQRQALFLQPEAAQSRGGRPAHGRRPVPRSRR